MSQGLRRLGIFVGIFATMLFLSGRAAAQSPGAPVVTPLGPVAGKMPAQTPGPSQLPQAGASDPNHVVTPLPPARPLTPDMLELINLEGTFADSVAKGGGKAFASWFAEDGMTLSNGKPPVLGRDAIALTATWDPKEYQLTWFAEGEQMGPDKQSAFTWGHYDATTIAADGKTATVSGRYITIWKKVKGEGGKKEWKVAMDASAEEPPKL